MLVDEQLTDLFRLRVDVSPGHVTDDWRIARVMSVCVCKHVNTEKVQSQPYTYIKYSLDFLRPIITAEAFEAVDWLADLPQQTRPQAGRSSDVILTSHFVEVNSRNFGGGHVFRGCDY